MAVPKVPLVRYSDIQNILNVALKSPLVEFAIAQSFSAEVISLWQQTLSSWNKSRYHSEVTSMQNYIYSLQSDNWKRLSVTISDDLRISILMTCFPFSFRLGGVKWSHCQDDVSLEYKQRFALIHKQINQTKMVFSCCQWCKY